MKTYGFIGLGLIGGSIARAIRETQEDARIIAHDVNQESLRLALSDGRHQAALAHRRDARVARAPRHVPVRRRLRQHRRRQRLGVAALQGKYLLIQRHARRREGDGHGAGRALEAAADGDDGAAAADRRAVTRRAVK